tara:strand:+ start:1173 stop:1340 length:168 start_codon:yes stop_codon:yes gene_type:complete
MTYKEVKKVNDTQCVELHFEKEKTKTWKYRMRKLKFFLKRILFLKKASQTNEEKQ